MRTARAVGARLTHVDDPLTPPVVDADGTLLTPSENIMQSCYQISRLCQMFRKAVQVRDYA